MYQRVLICGLPGSGKTTFANSLINEYRHHNRSYQWYNGDRVREDHNDWDFSIEGRLRQTIRMVNLANSISDKDVIIDYICPLEEYRYLLSPTIIIYLDTSTDTKHTDTKKIFEPPSNVFLTVRDKDDITYMSRQLYKHIVDIGGK